MNKEDVKEMILAFLNSKNIKNRLVCKSGNKLPEDDIFYITADMGNDHTLRVVIDTFLRDDGIYVKAHYSEFITDLIKFSDKKDEFLKLVDYLNKDDKSGILADISFKYDEDDAITLNSFLTYDMFEEDSMRAISFIYIFMYSEISSCKDGIIQFAREGLNI